ncbi:hypothetical protein MHBO_004647 [Bonamia ostreae]|uniref:L-asparaginase N-terminal domain-containing protein n=1 Tax=Bonamia ostreae TaxID=126728 RepID=A0ABV2ATW4_9EUKA
MAYTATALSFMLENLAKPVVFTGAAIPLGRYYAKSLELFNDAERNLVASLYVAAQADIPEVVICFSNKLTRANRTTKFDNWAQNSFESPNYPFLGRIGTNLSLFRDNILNPPKYKLKTFTNLFTNIGVIWLIPGFEDSIIQSTAKDENKKAIVLICYGSGFSA